MATRKRKTLSERLWAKVDTNVGKDDCWEFKGSRNEQGYGRIFSGIKGSSPLLAHRVSWELANGPIPKGLLVLHRCDNPSCIRISHLFLGSHQDNSDDAVSKRRMVHGSDHHLSKLTEEQVIEIRNRYAARDDEYCTYASLALEYGISRNAVKEVVIGGAWSHIDNPHTELRSSLPTGEYRAKITYEEADDIRALRAQGYRIKDLAAMYDVNNSTISRIARGQNRVRSEAA